MKIFEKEKVLLVEKEVVSKVTYVCNKCGKEEVEDTPEQDFTVNNKIHEFGVNFGYGSSFDTEYWRFDLCNDCLMGLVKTFKHEPDGFGEDYGEKYLEFNEWKKE